MLKPKILVLTSSYPMREGEPSGMFVEELSKRLTHVFDVYVLAPFSNGSLKTECSYGVNIIRYKYWPGKKLLGDGEIMANLKQSKLLFIQILPFMVLQLISICKIVKKQKICVIHAHWLIPQALMAVLYKVFLNRRVKIVATIHGGDINNFNNIFGKKLKSFILKRIDELTVVSNAIKEKVINLGYKKTVYVYPMGVDTKLFTPEKKDQTIRIKHNIEGFFLLFVGGLIERKGIRYLIQAIPTVIKEFPDVKLVVIGDGNLKSELVELTKHLKISENITFLGPVPHNDLPPYFATADLFILPSFSEGFGLVIIEAMSCNSLVVTSNLEVIHDIISENKTGFFFKEINKVAIGEKITSILQNKEKFEIIRQNGRQNVIENFDWDIVRNNYTNLFYRLI